ncbi:MAG: hypothetical protein IJO33_03440 [Bacilli bacterium]|nr:hypothetical protein [Bacilli bacterium]
MKKKVVVMLAGILALINLNVANAASACSYEQQVELGKVASSVKAVYEEASEKVDPSLYAPTNETVGEVVLYRDYFKIIFTNITKDIYVKVMNDYNEEVKFIRYKDTTDGMYTLNWYNLDDVVNFTYEVYSSDETDCRNEKYFTNYLITPMYNEFHDKIICEGITDYLPCQKYITVKMKYSEQFEKINEYLEVGKKEEKEKEENKKWYEIIGDFIKEHKVAFIAGSSIIVIAGVAIVVVNIRRKRESVL